MKSQKHKQRFLIKCTVFILGNLNPQSFAPLETKYQFLTALILGFRYYGFRF